MLHLAKLYLTYLTVHAQSTGLFNVAVPMLSEAETLVGIRPFITGSNFLGHQILCSQYVSDLLPVAPRKPNIQGEKFKSCLITLEDCLLVHLGGKEALCDYVYLKSLFPTFYWA